MRPIVGHFKRRYGASPWHLIAHVIGFAIAAYAIVQLLDQKRWVNWLAWFLLAALLHDLVLLPAYSVIDRLAHALLRRVHIRLGVGTRRDRAHVPLINHVRAPALISGVLLLIYFPLILGPAGAGYFSATGHHPSGYLRNWLLITLALFVASAAIYAARVRAARSRRSSSPP
jgi:MFS family permease